MMWSYYLPESQISASMLLSPVCLFVACRKSSISASILLSPVCLCVCLFVCLSALYRPHFYSNHFKTCTDNTYLSQIEAYCFWSRSVQGQGQGHQNFKNRFFPHNFMQNQDNCKNYSSSFLSLSGLSCGMQHPPPAFTMETQFRGEISKNWKFQPYFFNLP